MRAKMEAGVKGTGKAKVPSPNAENPIPAEKGKDVAGTSFKAGPNAPPAVKPAKMGKGES
jgi:hypothetical protein